MTDPVLEGLAVEFGAGQDGPAPGKPVYDPDVRKVELRRPDDPSFSALAVRGQPAGQQGVFEDPEVCLGRRIGNTAFAGHIREVDHLAVAQGRYVEEDRKGRQVSHQTLGGDFFPQVVGNVGVEQLTGPARLVDPGQVALVEHPVEVEVAPELSGGEASEFVAHGAAAEQVGGSSPYLSSARSAEGEVQAPVFHEPVHLVKESRDLLDFVDDDLAPGIRCLRLDFLAQQFRPGGVAAELVALEQVDPAPVRVAPAQERALARLARAPEEEGLLSGGRQC